MLYVASTLPPSLSTTPTHAIRKALKVTTNNLTSHHTAIRKSQLSPKKKKYHLINQSIYSQLSMFIKKERRKETQNLSRKKERKRGIHTKKLQ
jgi:hypothetical protein